MFKLNIYLIFYWNEDVRAQLFGIILNAVNRKKLKVIKIKFWSWFLLKVDKLISGQSCGKNIQCQTYNGLSCTANLCQ